MDLIKKCPNCGMFVFEYRPVYELYWCNNENCKYIEKIEEFTESVDGIENG